MKTVKALSAVAALISGLIVCPASSMAAGYVVKDLGSLGGAWSVAMGINASGQVVGSSYMPGNVQEHAFITGANGQGMRDLGTLGGQSSYASAVNDSGQAVGSYYGQGNPGRAFITDANGQGMRDLGTLGGSVSYAHAINASGQVVGDSKTKGDAASHAFVTGANGVGMTDLGTNGQAMSYARGINASGQVVGFVGATDGDGQPKEGHLFITGPNAQGIESLGIGGPNSTVEAINDEGRVIGSLEKGGAFVTGPKGAGITTLGTEGSYAFGINALGQVVGTDGQAFVTGVGGVGKWNLNSLVDFLPKDVYLVDARGINDAGQIIANGSDLHAYLLTPSVPEPETQGLLIAGLAVLAIFSRHGSKNALLTPGD